MYLYFILFLFYFFLLPKSIFLYNAKFIKEDSHKDFKEGKLNNIGINHLGNLFLTPKANLIYDKGYNSLIWDIEKGTDGNFYFISQDSSKIHKISKDKSIEVVYNFKKHLFILDILIDKNNNLYIADTTNSRVIYFSLAEKKILQEYVFKEKFIWKMIKSYSSDTIYIVTGENACVYELSPSSKKVKKLFSSTSESHFLSLIQKDDFLYFGGNSSLYQFNLSSEETSILYQGVGNIKDILVHEGEIFFIESNSMQEKNIKKSELKNAFLTMNSIVTTKVSTKKNVKTRKKKLKELFQEKRKFSTPNENNILYKRTKDNHIIKLFETSEYTFIDMELSKKQDRIYIASSSGVILFLDEASKKISFQDELGYFSYFQDTNPLHISIADDTMLITSGNIGKIHHIPLDVIETGDYHSKVYFLKKKWSGENYFLYLKI